MPTLLIVLHLDELANRASEMYRTPTPTSASLARSSAMPRMSFADGLKLTVDAMRSGG